MPMFQYKCAKCDHVWERLVRNEDEEPKECPKCEAPKELIDKDINGLKPAHKYNGRGFYVTDYTKKKIT